MSSLALATALAIVVVGLLYYCYKKYTGYTVYPNMDSNYSDKISPGSGYVFNLTQAMAVANADPEIVAFNSGGWFKTALTLPLISKQGQDLYVKNSYKMKMGMK